MFVINSVVTRAIILSLICNPTNTATKVCADIGHGYKITPVFCQDIYRKFLLVYDPTSLTGNIDFKKRRGSKFDLGDCSQLDPLLGLAFGEGRRNNIPDGGDTISQPDQTPQGGDHIFHELAPRNFLFLTMLHFHFSFGEIRFLVHFSGALASIHFSTSSNSSTLRLAKCFAL